MHKVGKTRLSYYGADQQNIKNNNNKQMNFEWLSVIRLNNNIHEICKRECLNNTENKNKSEHAVKYNIM